MMIPRALFAATLSKIHSDLEKLLDTDADTVDVFSIAVIKRRVEAQLEMARTGLLDTEKSE